MLEPKVEPMQKEDLERVLIIEQASFTQPYSRDLFEEELQLDLAHPCVLKVGEALVGFVDYWIVKEEMHLINIAVDPAYRRLGLGSFMMEYLLRTSLEKGIQKIFLDVRTSNVAARALYQKFGFEKVGLRKRYYSDNNEDALVMIKEF